MTQKRMAARMMIATRTSTMLIHCQAPPLKLMAYSCSCDIPFGSADSDHPAIYHASNASCHEGPSTRIEAYEGQRRGQPVARCGVRSMITMFDGLLVNFLRKHVKGGTL